MPPEGLQATLFPICRIGLLSLRDSLTPFLLLFHSSRCTFRLPREREYDHRVDVAAFVAAFPVSVCADSLIKYIFPYFQFIPFPHRHEYAPLPMERKRCTDHTRTTYALGTRPPYASSPSRPATLRDCTCVRRALARRHKRKRWDRPRSRPSGTERNGWEGTTRASLRGGGAVHCTAGPVQLLIVSTVLVSSRMCRRSPHPRRTREFTHTTGKQKKQK